ncbi:oxygenase MpaB family protein [Pseudomonas sp. NCCP-436]|uniref:oxygenase MpaB family protein n=1 Tax=Pseudomonas sp. NCCP-436 TaxID=2842481 RepID=UPI001C7EB4AE|nr:oxygenase MpaB family protein [Pseudomonas sp. NCCP-436]GIZ12259.1 histidine kinase [Pseudomonas sp. NCCP-436]
MERLRQRIEKQIHSLTGASLGLIDFDQPRGDPGLFGPQSMVWKVHADFTSMMVGGVSALLLQMLHPLALAGVWDHSNFRQDMIGRLRRTSLFIAGTSYGSRQDAEQLIRKVRNIHLQVVGQAPDGRPYSASDPELLTWVHVSEVSQFLAAHLRYVAPQLSPAEQDRYYGEVALIAERLGAQDVPKSTQSVADYLQRMRPQLLCDERTREVVRLLYAAPMPSLLARPFGSLVMHAGVELLPDWGSDLLGERLPDWRRPLIRAAVQRTAVLVRWAMRNSAAQRARRRMAA